MDKKYLKPSWFQHLIPLKRIIPAYIYNRRNKIIRHFGKKIKKPDISDELISTLKEDIKPDIKKLSEFCGRDFLTFWNLD